MSKDKPTFTDPKTGESIKSTGLARWGTGFISGLVLGVFGGLYFGLFVGLEVSWPHKVARLGNWTPVGIGLLGGLGYGLVLGLVGLLVVGLFGGRSCSLLVEQRGMWVLLPLGGLLGGLSYGLGNRLVGGQVGGLVLELCYGLLVGVGVWRLVNKFGNLFTQRIHDGIARWQHQHRQRILRRQEYPHVPDRALSRAELSDVPEPTPMSLSPAEPAEKEAPPRLTENVDAPAEGEKQANPSQPRGEPT